LFYILRRISLSSFDVIQEDKGSWLWKKPPPESRKAVDVNEDGTTVRVKRKAENLTEEQKQKKLLKGIMLRHAQMIYPASTP